MSAMTRVLVADDHAPTRAGVRLALEGHGFRVCAEAGSAAEAIAGALRERPRVRAALRDGADELRAFRNIALLRQLDLPRPPDRPTDFAGAAVAARARGMLRLAERLERIASHA